MSEIMLVCLICTYNHKNSIAKAIESVLEQKTNFKFQIWVLDDASTDGTSDIIKEYADKYPEIVIPFINKTNKGASKNTFEVLKKINSKYFATLDGDDYWCDENKLQIQVDILENNPDCSFCAHNTIKKYPNNENNIHNNEPYVKLKIKSGKWNFPKSLKNLKITNSYLEPHLSSRVYRVSCLNLDKVNDPFIISYDTAVTFWFLQFGKMYYLDKIMSVYNYTFKGVYSGKNLQQKHYMGAAAVNKINKALNYKYNDMFLDFFKTKVPVSFFESIKIKYFTDKKDLDNVYCKILDKYITDENKRLNSKILKTIKLPLSKRKTLCIDIRREKKEAV